MAHIRSDVLEMPGYKLPEKMRNPADFIRLDTNENPYDCSPAVTDAIHGALKTGLSRYPDPSATAFRNKAGDVLGIDPDWILCGNGSDDILSICFRGFLCRGQVIRLASPSYRMYQTLAQMYGLRIDEVRYQSDWSLPDRFAQPSSDLKLAILSNPNNPSGTILDPDTIAAIAERLPCPLLIDEAYAELAGISCLELVDEHENILISRSMSKSYALAGIRFGYLVAQPQVIRQLLKVKEPYNCDTLSISAATAAIGDQAWLACNCSKIRHTLKRLQTAMQKLGFEVAESHANFIWIRHTQHAAKSLYEQLKERHILSRYLNYGYCDGLRISIGTDAEVDILIERLHSIV